MRILRKPEPDPELDAFRDGVAVLSRDGEFAGHVASLVSTFWSPSRLFTRQPWVWMVVVWADGTKERAVEDYPPWSYVAEMKQGYIEWVGGPTDERRGSYDIEWLPTDESEKVRNALGIRPEDF